MRVNRNGEVASFANAGLSGPVGIAVDPSTQEIFVANCRANEIVRVAADGTVTPFARSPMFKCPNGIAFDRARTLFVTNFRDNAVLEVARDGAVKLFARVSDKGLGHLCFKDDRFYVTAYASHAVYELSARGGARRLLGKGERGLVDGGAEVARLTFPNGIACDSFRPLLYLNEYLAESAATVPRRAIVRQILLDPPP